MHASTSMLIVGLRLVHILSGVLWAGFAVFATFYLLPVLQSAGPEGGKVMALIERRGLMVAMPLLALLAVLSGAWLYVHDMTGTSNTFASSMMGRTLGAGALAALIAFVIGGAVVRPSFDGAAKITATLDSAASDQERQARLAEAARLRTRGVKATTIITWLLLFTVAAMAVARYI